MLKTVVEGAAASALPPKSPSQEKPLWLKIGQVASGAGLVLATTRAVNAEIQGDRLRCVEYGTLGGCCLYTLWLSKQYASLRGVNECTAKLEIADGIAQQQTAAIQNLNQGVQNQTDALTAIQKQEIATLKEKERAQAVLEKEFKELKEKMDPMLESLHRAERNLQIKTEEFDKLQQERDRQKTEALQLMTRLQEEIGQLGTERGTLRLELQKTEALLTGKEKTERLLREDIASLSRMMTAQGNASSMKSLSEETKRLGDAETRAAAAMTRVAALLEEEENNGDNS